MKLVDQWHAIEAGAPGRLGRGQADADDRAAGRPAARGAGARPDQCGQGRLDARLRRAPRGRPAGSADGAAALRPPRRRADVVRDRAIRRFELGIGAPTRPKPRGDPREGVGGRELGRGARAAALRLDRPPLRARDRVEHAARPDGAPLRAAQPCPLRLAPRLHLPLLGPLGLRRVARRWPGAASSGSTTTGSRARPASSGCSPTRITWTPRGLSGSWAARRCRSSGRATERPAFGTVTPTRP